MGSNDKIFFSLYPGGQRFTIHSWQQLLKPTCRLLPRDTRPQEIQ